MLLHHTLGNGNFEIFANMSRDISCAVARLADPQDIAAQIDHVLRECWIQSRPVYITLPTDMVQKKVEGERLNTPINLEVKKNDAEKEDYVVQVVLKSLHAAKNPVILVDACAIRHRALDETHALIKVSDLPVFVTPMGKGAVDETLPTFGGESPHILQLVMESSGLPPYRAEGLCLAGFFIRCNRFLAAAGLASDLQTRCLRWRW
jgi:pyruvate decarboxylase